VTPVVVADRLTGHPHVFGRQAGRPFEGLQQTEVEKHLPAVGVDRRIDGPDRDDGGEDAGKEQARAEVRTQSHGGAAPDHQPEIDDQERADAGTDRDRPERHLADPVGRERDDECGQGKRERRSAVRTPLEQDADHRQPEQRERVTEAQPREDGPVFHRIRRLGGRGNCNGAVIAVATVPGPSIAW
jgi:hypothetical protein